jgi:probable rRNA maturation factor
MCAHTIEAQIDQEYQGQVSAETLRRAALAAVEHAGQDEPYEVAIVVTGDEALQELSSRFLGADRPTDVLAFPDDTRGPFVGAPGHPRYLGDVVVSLPRAEAQAREASHDLEAELQLLVIHGVLHLLGYDDVTEEDRSAMWSAQRTILKRMGIDIQLPEW